MLSASRMVESSGNGVIRFAATAQPSYFVFGLGPFRKLSAIHSFTPSGPFYRHRFSAFSEWDPSVTAPSSSKPGTRRRSGGERDDGAHRSPVDATFAMCCSTSSYCRRAKRLVRVAFQSSSAARTCAVTTAGSSSAANEMPFTDTDFQHFAITSRSRHISNVPRIRGYKWSFSGKAGGKTSAS